MAIENLYRIPGLEPATMIDTGDITLGVFCAGPEDGLPVVFCHGFPELAYTWRHQIPVMAAAGYRVLVPDMRGYGHSDKPDAITAYDMTTLCADMTGLLDYFGIDKAVFVGHDWGGMIIWQMPLRHPDRVHGLAGLNTPFSPRLPSGSVLDAYRKKFGEDMYILKFQEPGFAESILEENIESTMLFFMRRSDMTPAAFEDASAAIKSLDLLTALKLGNPDKWKEQCFLTEEELAVFTSVFSATGFTGGVNWYRNMQRNWESSADLPEKVMQPALMIMAENDLVLPPSLADGMETFVPNLSRHIVKDCGHWTQQEHPDEVNQVLLNWLAGL